MQRAGTTKRLLMSATLLSAVLTLDGCHHRRAAATLPAVLKAPDAQPPAPNSPPMEGAPPNSISTAPQVKVTETKPKRAPKKTPAKPAVPDPPPPVEEAANDVPSAEGSIGALSAGGDASPKTQQAASELIAACEQRVNDPLQNTKEQSSTIRKVRYFIKQAKQALGTGDAEGAMTLATKAKLLLDDLVVETK